MAWPGTPGGAQSPNWGTNVALYVWVAISPGYPFVLGPRPNDRLDSGNVLSRQTQPVPPVNVGGGGIWQDITCDVVSLGIDYSWSETDAAIGRPNAGTATVEIFDPDRIYDPLSPSSPFRYEGASRLQPGVPVLVFAETLSSPTTVVQHVLFSGTADSWDHDWLANPQSRRTVLAATDATKDLVALDRGEQPAVGTNDTVAQRIERILVYYGWTGTRQLETSTVTLQATTLAQSAWELILRAADDELGFVRVDPDNVLRFHNRTAWTTNPAPVITIGCTSQPISHYDVVIAADVGPVDTEIRNLVSAARTGGTAQIAKVQGSIDKYGEKGYKRTDLDLASDPQSGAWASLLVSLDAWPASTLQTVTMRPRNAQASWPGILGLDLVTDRIRVLWTPPGSTDLYDVKPRVVGLTHDISRTSWTVVWQLDQGQIRTRYWTLGAHSLDRLDDNNVLR